MNLLTIQHVMDEHPRQMTLNDAFIEALHLSEGRACEIEEKEYELLCLLEKYPSFIDNITEDYKLSVLEGWEYAIIN